MTVSQAALALGVGVGGALVDVSSRVNGTEGVTYSWGRQSEFRDPNPGQVTFVLDNYDGRFTPGNTASSDPTPLTEGTAVCWQCGTRLVGMVVTGIGFASTEAEWGRVTITCGDVFAISNRTLANDVAAAIGSTQSYLWWPLTDPATSGQALEKSGNGGPAMVPDRVSPATAVFGVAPTAPTTDTQATFSNPTVNAAYWATAGNATFPPITYPAGSFGTLGMWVTPQTPLSWVEFDITVANGAMHQLSASTQGSGFGTVVQFLSNGGGVGYGSVGVSVSTAWVPGQAHYISASITYSGTTFTANVYIDGKLAGSQNWTATGVTNAAMQVVAARVLVGDGVNIGSASVAHLSFTSTYRNEPVAGVTSEAARIAGILQMVPSAQLGTIDTNLSTAVVDQLSSKSNVSAWQLLCDALRSEQGHIYTTTSGTLLSPTTVVNVRARTRPTTVSLQLDAALDLDGVPQFDRDITNLFGVVTATGPSNSATVTDAGAVLRVGSASTTDNVVYQATSDLLGYAQDRMLRGKNIAMKVAKIVVDTVHSTVTAAQIMALLPGDRIRISGLPGGALGFTAWDGWFLGASEVHNYQSDSFTLYVAPVLPATGIYDTDRFAAGTDLSLNASITSAVTSFVVTTANPLTFLETVQVPYALQIDQEQVTVTACTALSGTTQTLTVTRGANGTTPAAHNAGALVEIATPAIYAY